MIVSSEFYKDEVRCGFYVPTAIKQAWAAALMVLAEIDRICTKYGIEYFADWGTLIGVVRHGGFVPWDDDLDICMKREDYIRFREVADRELSPEYVIHDYERQENHWLFIARICNTRNINFSKEHLDKFHNFPYISAIDIFVQDYVYRDPDKENERCDSIKYLLAVADGIINEEFNKSTIETNLSEIECKYGVIFDRGASARNLGIAIYKLIEKRLGETPESEADNLVQLFPWGIKGVQGLPKRYYEHIIRLPFENTTIPVPACYAKVLANRYGDYLKIHKIWGGHGYPYFEAQKANLQVVVDFKLPEFSFDSSMLERPEVDDSGGIKAISKEWLAENKEIFATVRENIYGADIECSDDRLLTMLADCQQSAVDYGSYIEQVIGADRQEVKRVVAALEAYCETLFALYNTPEDTICLEDMGKALDLVESEIASQIINKQIIVFVVDDINRFREIEPLYKRLLSDRNNLVYTVFVVTDFKDIYGSVTKSDSDRTVKDGDKVNLSTLIPDIIFFQNPYDAQNPCLTLPEEYYASNMRLIARQLIYVAPEVDEFDLGAINDIYNMKHYVTAPGVILADRIYIQSENMKEMYVKKLAEFCGEDTESIWRGEIDVRTDIYDTGCNVHEKHIDCPNATTRKKLLYCFGENELFEHDRDKLKEAINKRLSLFESNREALDITVCIYPQMLEKDCQKYFMGIEYISYSEVDTDVIRTYDAYYGSPSPLVLRFVRAGKAVMISDYDV